MILPRNKLIIGYILIFTITLPLGAEEIYWRSNEVGMALNRIEWYKRDEYPYVLLIEEQNLKQIKRLLHEGEEEKRWEYIFYEDGNISVESEYDEDKISIIRRYDRSQRLWEEEIYSQGELEEKKSYNYATQGLASIDTYNAEQELLYTDIYLVSESGKLRELKRTWPDGSYRVSRYIFGKGLLVQEWNNIEEKLYISRYNDDSKLIMVEVWNGEQLEMSRAIEYYQESGEIKREQEIQHQNDKELIIQYNEQGDVIAQKKIIDGEIIEEINYIYDEEGNNIRKKKKGESGIEEWRYTYNASNDLIKEEYLHTGSLEKVTFYTDDDTYYDELYREGKVFVRIHYYKDNKVKEEFIVGGEVIRVREFGNEEDN